MIFLRIFLFSGMVFHKAVWEYMKRGSLAEKKESRPFELTLKSLVKLFKSLVLLFLIVQTLFLTLFPILKEPFTLRVIGIAVYLLGLAIAVTGRLQLGRNWVNLEDYQVIPDQQLVKNGIYRFIRHPIYTGDILLILGLELALNSWLVLIVVPLVVVVVRQTLAEEAILAKAFSGYEDYRRATKMFIPFVV